MQDRAMTIIYVEALRQALKQWKGGGARAGSGGAGRGSRWRALASGDDLAAEERLRKERIGRDQVRNVWVVLPTAESFPRAAERSVDGLQDPFRPTLRLHGRVT